MQNLGRYDKARELDDDTLTPYLRVLGEDHPGTLASANNLAIDLSRARPSPGRRELDKRHPGRPEAGTDPIPEKHGRSEMSDNTDKDTLRPEAGTDPIPEKHGRSEMSDNTDFVTFGHFAETPVSEMPGEMKQAYDPASRGEANGGLPAGNQAIGDPASRHSRRSLLRAGMFGGGAAALLAAGRIGTGGTALAAEASPAVPQQLQTLFPRSPVLDFETLFAFGSIGYGCAEFGELVTAVNQVNAAGASFQTYYDTFLTLAQRTRTLADGELAAGHPASARSAYLRAATYYDMCLYFILGTTVGAQRGRRVRGHARLLAARHPALRPAVRAGTHPLRPHLDARLPAAPR